LWPPSPGARNLTDPVGGFLADKEFIILDRDSKYASAFGDLLEDAGVQVVRLPPRSPNLNAYAERFVRSIKDECLHRMILFGERSLRKATREFAAHYHTERNHQGLNNRLIESEGREGQPVGPVECAPLPAVRVCPSISFAYLRENQHRWSFREGQREVGSN